MQNLARGLCLVSLLAAGSAHAADPGEGTTAQPDIIIELGVGGKLVPKYEGARHYQVTPYPIVGLDYLSIPGLLTFGSIDPQNGGFKIGPSFDYVDERKSNRYDAIRGLDNVDATYQGGIKLGYEWDFAEIYGEARYAFGGAEGFVGDLGANLILRPLQEVRLKVGPTVSFASGDYMDTYFGVSPTESLRTGGRLDAFDPGGGIKSAGVAASARYEFQPSWFLNANASWDRYLGDAADSPVVKAGDKNQYMVGLGISKRFSLDLF